ncbi:MAG: hypothetical protein IJR49_06290 [Treponema sp.]|nr:hypothetical protein [Treponema sp.]
MKGISPEVIRSVDSAMYEKSLALSNENEEKIDGLSSLAEILRRLPSSYEDEILASISKEDASIGESLRSKLFTLDDVENSDDRFIQEKLRDMSEKEIAYLIAGKKESFRKKILANVSTARGDTILEEEVLHKPMLKKDVDEVTNIFLKDLRLAYEDGKFRVAGRDNEEYVE